MEEQFRNEDVTIGTTALILCREQSKDQVLYRSIINTGTTTISLAINAEAKAGKGIVIYPGGNAEDAAEGNILPTNAFISAISSAAGGTVAVHERIAKRS